MILFRRRNVRLHQLDPAPSVEGVLVGKPWRNGGHYVLRKPEVLAEADRSVVLAGPEAWVPRERVVLVEVLA